MNENDFLLKSVHEEFEKRVEEENSRQNHRISSLETALNQIVNLVSSVERLATNMEHMAKEQQDQGDRLKVLESRDGEKWRSVASHTIVSIVTLILGYMASKLGF